jgi:hypothetical protein
MPVQFNDRQSRTMSEALGQEVLEHVEITYRHMTGRRIKALYFILKYRLSCQFWLWSIGLLVNSEPELTLLLLANDNHRQ